MEGTTPDGRRERWKVRHPMDVVNVDVCYKREKSTTNCINHYHTHDTLQSSPLRFFTFTSSSTHPPMNNLRCMSICFYSTTKPTIFATKSIVIMKTSVCDVIVEQGFALFHHDTGGKARGRASCPPSMMATGRCTTKPTAPSWG